MGASFSFSYFSCSHLCLLVVLALFHLCSSKQYPEHVLCIDAERQALLEFKHDLIDEAHQLTSWVDEAKDCCKWFGIACDNSTGHVHVIHLPGADGHCLKEYYYDYYSYEEVLEKRLRGYISSSLLNLKQLKHLDLSCNLFNGIQVPKFIGSLQNLRYLNLSNSYFSGIIPPQLGNLSKLHVLCLGNFQSGKPPMEATAMMNMEWLSSLRSLHHLDLSGVILDEATDWFQAINTLHSLVSLHLSNCYLFDIHPHVHRLNLTSLSLLDLSFNFFQTSMPQWLFGLTSLVSLDLTFSYKYTVTLSSIYNFRNLTSLQLLYIRGIDFLNSSLVLQQLSSTSLISLDICKCGISSSVLDSLQNLTSLLSLDVSQNVLTKRIPKQLGNVCNLRVLDLSRNKFGTLSLTHLLEMFLECKSPTLESLSLFNTYIAGIIPHSIGQLPFLRALDLHDNQLNGSLPDSLGQLSELAILDFSYNLLTGSLPNSLGQLSKLANLDFSHNLLTGIITEAHFSKLTSMKTLYGGRNNFTLRLQVANWNPPFRLIGLNLNSWVLGPQFPSWLQSQTDLTTLDISNTEISSPMPESFARSFPELRYLDISHNQIQGKLPLLGIPPTLSIIDLSSNEFWGSLHNFLCLNGMKYTQGLNFGNNLFSGAIPECWEMWPNLVALNLENNNISGEIPRTLGSISRIQMLNIRGNKISGRLPTSLMNLTHLMVLQLDRNQLIGSIPRCLGTKLTSLILLNLRSNKFDGIIPHELCYLINIRILDLSHNGLSGNIPRCFNNYSFLSEAVSPFFRGIYTFSTPGVLVSESLVIKGKVYTYSTILGLVKLLDLSSNNLVGHIPSELTSLQSLNSLNLSRNRLIGRIPEKIGDMKALESFDLSVNKLSGKLPSSLSMLNYLSSFNVSYNNFTGKIPVSTQLQSMPASSFFGNKLCGALLTDNCGKVETPAHEIREKKEEDAKDWELIISIIIGFITGFWIIVAPLILSRLWRIAYFHMMSKFMKRFCFY